MLLLFFLFFSHFPFFLGGCAVLLFSVLDIFLFLSGGRRICSSCFFFGLFSLFLIFWGLVFSLSLPRSPEQAAPK